MESFIGQADRRRRDLEARHRPWRPQTLPGLLDAVPGAVPGPAVRDRRGGDPQLRRPGGPLGRAGPRPDRPRGAGRRAGRAGPAQRPGHDRGAVRGGAGRRGGRPGQLPAARRGTRPGAAAVRGQRADHDGGIPRDQRPGGAGPDRPGLGTAQPRPSARPRTVPARPVAAPPGTSRPAPGGSLARAPADRDRAARPGGGPPRAADPGGAGHQPGSRPGRSARGPRGRRQPPRMSPRSSTRRARPGCPKGVLSTHDMELRSAYGSAYTRAFEDGRRIMFALPLNHVFAYIEGLLASMFVAGAVVVQPVFDPGPRWPRSGGTRSVRHCSCPP